jgi:hypothetical protein
MSCCFICHKKLSLVECTTNKCKCDEIFCKKHKEPIQHQCTFNFFTANCNILKENLTPVVQNKVIRL